MISRLGSSQFSMQQNDLKPEQKFHFASHNCSCCCLLPLPRNSRHVIDAPRGHQPSAPRLLALRPAVLAFPSALRTSPPGAGARHAAAAFDVARNLPRRSPWLLGKARRQLSDGNRERKIPAPSFSTFPHRFPPSSSPCR